MPTELTPREAIIKLNRIRTDKDERPPEIDMAIRAINKVFVKRKPEPELRYYGIGRCPNCGVVFIGGATNHCSNGRRWFRCAVRLTRGSGCSC